MFLLEIFLVEMFSLKLLLGELSIKCFYKKKKKNTISDFSILHLELFDSDFRKHF